MKLLIYSHFFAPGVGGVETIVLSLARGLAGLHSPQGTAEFDVTLATQTPAGNFADSALPFRVVRNPSTAQLWGLVRSSDVIHLAGPAFTPLLLCWLRGKPFTIEHHGYQAICPNGLLLHKPEGSVCPGHFQSGNYGECFHCLSAESGSFRALANLLLQFPRRFLASRAAQNIAVSEHALRRIPLPRSVVLYHGIEDTLSSKPDSDTAALEDQPQICFAFVGRFVPEKGLSVLLQAVQLLKGEGYGLEVRLIGDGPLRPTVEKNILDLGIGDRVKITGFLSAAALTEALREVRVVVMPSTWEETAGLSAIEQMMRGRLVIASAIGGLAEIVGDTGLLFPAGDSTALARCMRQVLQNPQLIDSFGEKARARALHLFVRQRMIADHASLYRNLTAPASRA